jgi:ubiquinone/menaquinone biosynthesis C-methylase UbiE
MEEHVMTVTEREQTQAAWDKIASGYDAFVTPSHIGLANEGLRRAGLRAGMRFLDVAAGTGALSIPAARLGARVLAIDQSAKMLELLAMRAQKEGLKIQTQVMDGHALELDDNSFDTTGSQFGVMLFPDMPQGIREMARVTRPGGRVLLHAYGAPQKIEFLNVFVRAVRAVRPEFDGLSADPPPLPLQLQDPERLRKEFLSAGLHHIEVETFTETLQFAAGRPLWDWLISSNPIVETVLGGLALTGDERGMIGRALETIVRDRAGSSGAASLTNPVNIGVGAK